MVTARINSPVAIQVPPAETRAMAMIQVAQRSASLTILAFPASADWTRRTMRWMELSFPVLAAFMSKVPNWLTVPLETSSPASLSLGRGSPVITDWLTEVCPERITPSAGIVSPGNTRRISPMRTSSAGITSSLVPSTFRAVAGVKRTSLSIPFRARATVSSSRSSPSCMMNAISAAAKSSPMMTEATRATETRTSALISQAVARPRTASSTMGTPHSTMAIHETSKGKGSMPSMLINRANPETDNSATFRLVPPHSSNFSNRSSI